MANLSEAEILAYMKEKYPPEKFTLWGLWAEFFEERNDSAKDYNHLHARITDLEKKMDDLLDNLEDRLHALEVRVNDILHRRMDKLEIQLVNLNCFMGNLQTNLEVLHRQSEESSELKDKVDRLHRNEP